MSGYVYAVTNPSIPGLVKIGRTANLNKRMDTLYCSSVPHPFECEAVQEVEDPNAVEATLHSYLSGYRVTSKREFFKVDVEQVKKLFDLVGAGVKPKPKAEQHDGPTIISEKGFLVGEPSKFSIEVDGHFKGKPRTEKLRGETVKELYDLISEKGFLVGEPSPEAFRTTIRLPNYQTIISRKNKGWTLEQAFGFRVPPNYAEADERYIKDRGFEYYPEKPTEDGNRVPLVAHNEKRVYLSQLDFAKEHGIPADYVSDKLKSPCGWMAHEIVEMYNKEEKCQP